MKKVSVKYNIILCVIFMTGFWGCGVKGNPVIIKHVSGKPHEVRNLKASVAGHAVSLKWNHEAAVSANHYVAVGKNELCTVGSVCIDYPRPYELIGPISLNDR